MDTARPAQDRRDHDAVSARQSRCDRPLPESSSGGSTVRRHYLHYDYANEKREAWQLLGERLDAILTNSNVVPLQRAA